MKSKIILTLSFLVFVSTYCYSSNPFGELEAEMYAGYYTSKNMSLCVAVYKDQFYGKLNRNNNIYTFKEAILKEGVLEGAFGKNKIFSFTAKLKGDRLFYKSGVYEDTLTKNKSKKPFTGNFASDKLKIELFKNSEGNYTGKIKLIKENKIFSAEGKAAGVLFYGKFKDGEKTYPFTLLRKKQNKIIFNSDSYNEILKEK
ncbi:MAG: hypothetical protein K9M56_01985 [Victivallales bacterium]|nr:hypothetical protein [Victivallales bacterium]